MRGRQSGFTLVELVVTIACSSLVVLAAMSLLLVCIRVNNSAQAAASHQNTARIVLSLLENAVGTGTVDRVETVGADWTLFDDGGKVLLRYSSNEGALKTSGGNVMMDDVEASSIDLDANNLLTLSVQTDGAEYDTSIYCRTSVEETEYANSDALVDKAQEAAPGEDDRLAGTQQARYQFLVILSSQYDSGGEIKSPYDQGEYEYFSEWYIGSYEGNPGWNADTPWCACFLSWAVAQKPDILEGTPPHFANVGDGMDDFQEGSCGDWMDAGEDAPLPGDFIFFDWDGDGSPDHVGAVLLVESGMTYTIEGNSGGKVAVHSYTLDDSQIMGYGQLKWSADEPMEGG